MHFDRYIYALVSDLLWWYVEVEGIFLHEIENNLIKIRLKIDCVEQCLFYCKEQNSKKNRFFRLSECVLLSQNVFSHIITFEKTLYNFLFKICISRLYAPTKQSWSIKQFWHNTMLSNDIFKTLFGVSEITTGWKSRANN